MTSTLTLACVCSPATVDGLAYSQWVGTVFGDCVYTSVDWLSFALGMVSLALYAVAMLPQLWKNYRRKTVDGLSLSFLGIWVLGDVANVVGAVFTNQLPTVQYTGLYFVLSDVASIAQWLYYKSCYPRRIRRRVGSVFLAHGDESARGDGYMALVEEDEEQEQDYCAERDNDTKADAMRTESRLSGATRNSGSSTTSLGMPRPTTTMIAALALAVCVAAVELDTEMHITNDQPPLCNADSTLARPAVILGMAMSWASGLLYFSSRLPQIMTNWRRKNVAGLSVSLFILTFAANLSYGVSIILRPPASEKFFTSTLPFLLGSMGTLVFDAVILLQTAYYRRPNRIHLQ